MDIEGAVAWLIQDCLRQNLPEGGHNREISLIGSQGGAILGLFKRSWLPDGNAMSQGCLLDGREYDFASPSRWFIRACHYGGNLIALRQDCPWCGPCDQRVERSEE